MDTNLQNPIITAKPGKSYWRQYFLVGPTAGAMVGTPFAALYVRLFYPGAPERVFWTAVLVCGALGTLLVVMWGVRRDQRKLQYALYGDRLVLGIGRDCVEVFFSEIESIALGLPRRVPLFVKLVSRDPRVKGVLGLRANCLVVRMTNQRVLPLSLGLIRAPNGGELLRHLLELNKDKVQKTAVYTPEEERAFSMLRLNKVTSY